jgi:crooked neck
MNNNTGEGNSITKARDVYKKAYNSLRNSATNEARVMVLEAWQEFEQANGEENECKIVENLMPKQIRKRRKIQADDGVIRVFYNGYNFFLIFMFFV